MRSLLASLVAISILATACGQSAPAPQTAAPAKPAAAQPAAAGSADSSYPNKGIELIVGFDPGSGSDATSRAISPFLAKYLKQNVTVVNRPGAGGVISFAQLAREKPDGYTIGIVPMPSVFNSFVTTKVEYDPLKDFSYLAMVANDPVTIAVKADSPYKTVTDLIDAAKKSPERISIGATGKVSTDYTIALSLEKASGAKFAIVNVDGTPAGIAAVLGGNMDAMGMNASGLVSYVKAGQLRALAVGGDKRFADLPDAPTFKEAGVSLLVHGNYRPYAAPKAIPDNVKASLANAFKSSVEDSEFVAQAKKMSLPLEYMTPDQVTTLAENLLAAAKEYLK